MQAVYRKSLKGIDELAFSTGQLTLRRASYLLAVDGISTTAELAARHPHLQAMDMTLADLLQQGFIEHVNSKSGHA
jgi:hypothetical protein